MEERAESRKEGEPTPCICEDEREEEEKSEERIGRKERKAGGEKKKLNRINLKERKGRVGKFMH